MDRVEQMLVVLHGQADVRASVQGVYRVARRDQDAVEGSRSIGRGWLGGATSRDGQKRVGYRVRSVAGSGNTNVRGLLPDEGYIEAVLDLLRNTKVGLVKEGVIVR